MRSSLWLTGLLALGVSLLVADEPFFWDTIQLGARHADWFFQQPPGTLLLPDEMDSGHIPAFGFYLATCWRLFGQTLLVSHLAMFPFIWLVLWQGYRLVPSVPLGFGAGNTFLPSLVLLLDATLVAQLSLISPDIVLIGAFLLALNSINHKQPAWLVLAVGLLGLASLRGMIVALGLFLWQVITFLTEQKEREESESIIQLLLPYLPGGILALAYLFYHYWIKGWIGTHPDSPWAASFASQGGISIAKQAAVVVWRFLDFGRVFLVLALFLSWWRSGWAWTRAIKRVVILLLIMGFALALPALISPGLSQHRYLLPVYLTLAYLLLLLLQELPSKSWRSLMVTLVVLGQISGHFWIYPDRIAQGWDASLAHKPYFEARAAGLAFLQQEKIPLSTVGTAFPEVGELHLRTLNGMKDGFTSYDLDQQAYIWHSNIMNDFADEERLALQENWTPVFTFRKRGVHLEIYHHK